MHQLSSPLSSPARKRQRLSSPPFEGSIDTLSQSDIAVFEALETKYTQAASGFSQPSHGGKPTLIKSSIPNDLADDAENPFTTAATFSGFASASSLRVSLGEPVSETFHEAFHPSGGLTSVPESDTGFKQPTFPGFQAASEDIKTGSSTTSAGMGFTIASKRGLYAPSSAALAVAQAKIAAIWNEEEEDQITPSSPAPVNVFGAPGGATVQKRPALRVVENAFNSPRTPLHSSTNSRTIDATPFSPLTERLKDKGKAREVKGVENVQHELGNLKDDYNSTPPIAARPRQFISPLITPQTRKPMASDSTAAKQNKSTQAFTSATSQLSASQYHFVTPSRVLPTAGTLVQPRSTESKQMGSAKLVRPFVTPFKSGMKPEGFSSIKSPRTPNSVVDRSRVQHTRPVEKSKRPCFFDLSLPANRTTLRSSGLVPQEYEVDDLDMSLIELTQVTPSLALFYSFHSSSNETDPRASTEKLGPPAALDELKRRGCALATKSWVDNHWSFILWKLSGMALLNPDQERDPRTRKWCWSEVMRQLLYRYERELNQGKRPALRMITTHDAPAACPMVLCVSNIFWSESERSVDGLAADRVPELELSDGWYRLRATPDPPMARAVGRGLIRIGRKIGVAGAWLSSEKKEPSEVLEAYNNVKLVLHGNSSHLMPWHAKLGFQRDPFISTLHSLTADGGRIAVVDVVVTKAFPLAYIEFIEIDGQKHREGPRNEAEEAKLHDRWKRKREQEAFKLRSELDKRFGRFNRYADRLVLRAAKISPNEDESPPSDMDELYDLLEDPREADATIARLSPLEAAWLARHIRSSIDQEKERVTEDIERDLQKSCPPRDVRNFRVITVQDARTRRRPANRIAQITVWDALGFSPEEGNTKGIFQPGQRYLVTNLVPTQQSAWMNCEAGSQIFLSTRRDSRWKRLQ